MKLLIKLSLLVALVFVVFHAETRTKILRKLAELE